MPVQAQYPSSVLLLNRKEQERKEFSQSPHDFLLSSMELLDDRGDGNPRKRAREAAGGVPMAAAQSQLQPINLFGMQPNPASSTPPAASPTTMVSLARLQSHPPLFVSTGLRLSFEYNQHQSQTSNRLPSTASSSSFPSLFSQDLVAQINQQREEIDQFLLVQGEQLRRTLAERRLRHYRALLSAAESSAVQRLRVREAELERATRRGDELQEHLGRLQTELRAWQDRAIANQAMAATLHAQLEHAMAVAAAAAAPAFQGRGDDECGESHAAEDAESAFVDPDRVDRGRACCTCQERPATVVLLPCRHLCLCEACDAVDTATITGGGSGGIAASCPVCRCLRTGSLQVFLA